MLSVGDVVDAEVTNVQVFGIFCRHRDEELLVLIPETSWIASACSCKQFAEPGDTVTVKIINVDAESRKIAATIKGRHPNPWETDQLDVGRRYSARIVRYVEESDRCNDQPAFLIELLPGAFTMLCDTQKSFVPGDHVTVIIRSSDPRKRAVEVALENDSEQSVQPEPRAARFLKSTLDGRGPVNRVVRRLSNRLREFPTVLCAN